MPVQLALGPDGRLGLFDGSGQVRWRTQARNAGWTAAVAILRNDGNLVVLSEPAMKKPVWASGTPDGTGKVGNEDVIAPADRRTLQQGKQLNAGQSLMSASGLLQLAMQTDGNLVLYAKGSGDTWQHYWDTGTWSLPEAERPVRLVLTDQAGLHLLDADGTKRWASGTWGNGYIKPFLAVQGDGNLVLYHDTWRAYWATGTPSGSGAIGPKGHRPGSQDLDTAVEGFGRLPKVVTGSTDIESSATNVDVDGVNYRVTTVQRRLVNQIVDQAFLKDTAELGVWPGQIIQGAPLLASDVASIPGFARMRGTVEVVTNLIVDNPGPQHRPLDRPTSDAANTARREILAAIRPRDSAGILKVDIDRASTYNEFATKFGFQVKGPMFGVEGNLDLNGSFKESTVVLVIRQQFYTTTFTPSGHGAGGLWDETKVRFDELEPCAYPGNPPLYIHSVSYGRLICVTAQGAHSVNSLSATLKAEYSNVVSGEAELTHEQKQILESSRIKIYTVGVPGRIGFQELNDPLTELDHVFRGGLLFSQDNPGAAVSFTARHIADNTLATVGLVADYIAPLQAVGDGVHDAYFEVWDGPMGGNVPTGILVNPGDTVSIRADGRISSGIIFSAPHGPDGWIGHISKIKDTIKPGGHPPFGLIHRYGGREWLLTFSQFSKVVEATEGRGPIMLAINDSTRSTVARRIAGVCG